MCCIRSPTEARLAIDAGADAVGLVSAMPSGPGVIPDDAIAEIAKVAPPAIGTFLLTSRTDGPSIAGQARLAGVNTVQIVDAVPRDVYSHLRSEMPHLRLVQVLHVWDEAAVEQARECVDLVDALLLDSGNPNAAVKELGGTGRTHNWAMSRRIVEFSPRPVFLAGGLSSANALAAIREVGPWGLDVCSGVRTQGRLDPEKLGALVRAIREA